MPNTMIHEQVAYNIAQKHKNLDTPNFYLGALAPDAVNLNGFASKEKRWTSHLRDKDLKVWRQNIIEFYYKEKNNYPSDFLKGYFIHILTDIIYDDYFYSSVTKRIKEDGKNIIDPHPIMLNYMNEYAIENKNSKITKHIKNKLIEAAYYDIRNITKDNLKSWAKSQLEYASVSPKPNPYINDDLITKLTNCVLVEYDNYIRE